MKNEYISRQAAIDAIANCTNCGDEKTLKAFVQKHNLDNGWTGGVLEAIDAIEDLPSAQPEPQWIPCSERLPEKRDWCLGIFEEPDTGWINPIPFICDYLHGKKTKATTKEGWILKECTDREEHIDYYFNLKCVAWMPLPEPWRGDSICK